MSRSLLALASLSLALGAAQPVFATVPTDLYPCAPGGPNDYLYIMVVTSRMYDAFATAIGRPERSSPEGRHAGPPKW